MKKYSLCFVVMLIIGGFSLFASGMSRKVLGPETPPASLQPSPIGFAYLGSDIGPSVDVEFAKRAIELLNQAVRSDCFKKDPMIDFKSTENVRGKKYTVDEARLVYVSGAPYALDLRWYSKRFSSVVGYTYNYKNNDAHQGSETRIYSNVRKMGTEKDYAAHLAHEISHQLRAGGFVHYTFHQGSFPYEIGDLVWKCLH